MLGSGKHETTREVDVKAEGRIEYDKTPTECERETDRQKYFRLHLKSGVHVPYLFEN